MRYDNLKIIVFPYIFYSSVQMLTLIYTVGKPWFLQWHIPWLINAILLKLGGVTAGTHTYQYWNIQVARGNGSFHEIIRIINLCDCPERSPKVKSVMAQYLKIHFIRYTNYVQSFMLLSKSAQFFAMPPHYSTLNKIEEHMRENDMCCKLGSELYSITLTICQHYWQMPNYNYFVKFKSVITVRYSLI